jgi:hypothetical protein
VPFVSPPTGVVGNNAISMEEGRVYLIERTSAEVIARAKKRGETVPASWKLVALDAATGKVASEAQDMAAEQAAVVEKMKEQYEAWFDDVASRWQVPPLPGDGK